MAVALAYMAVYEHLRHVNSNNVILSIVAPKITKIYLYMDLKKHEINVTLHVALLSCGTHRGFRAFVHSLQSSDDCAAK